MGIFSVFFVKPQDDYHPEWPQWLRWLGWAWRNPFPGLVPALEKPLRIHRVRRGVIGQEMDPPVPAWNPQGGWWSLWILDANDTSKRFRSYRGKWIEGYFGWRPNGSFGIAFRKAKSKGY